MCVEEGVVIIQKQFQIFATAEPQFTVELIRQVRTHIGAAWIRAKVGAFQT